MRKVYCVIFDYEGYESKLTEIYYKEKDAIERLVTRAHEYGYDNAVDFMNECELSLVEWECDLNNRRLIKPSYDW